MPVDFRDLENRCFTVEEIAPILGMDPQGVRRLIRLEKLRAVRPEGARAFRVLGDDAIRYLKGLPPLPVGNPPEPEEGAGEG